MRTIIVLAAFAAVSGAMIIAGSAAAKGPFRAGISGDWGSGDRYYEASAAFRATLDGAIGVAVVEEGDGVGLVWYIAPGLASVGLVLIGGLAGRPLLSPVRAAPPPGSFRCSSPTR